MTPAGVSRVADRCAEYRLQPVSVHVRPFRSGTPFDLPGETSSLLWALSVCKRLGASVLKFTGPKRDTEGGSIALTTVLRDLMPTAEDMGMLVVLENHFANAIEFAEDYERIFSEVSSDNLGVCLDLGHFGSSGVDPTDVVQRLPDKIFHIDIKDCARAGSTDFVRYGTGIVDIPRALEACQRNGFCGFMVIELPVIDRATVVEDLLAGIKVTEPFASTEQQWS